MEAASIAHAEHHGPPPAHRSSRVEAPTLGMLLFIISEVMIFGAFFTAYFFIRVVSHDPWPAHGTVLPEAVAGINTAILLSSSLTIHWALTSIKNGNRWGLRAGMLTTFLLGLTFLTVQVNDLKITDKTTILVFSKKNKDIESDLLTVEQGAIRVAGTPRAGFLQNCSCYLELAFCPDEEMESALFIRVRVEDRAGVLAQIAAVFGNHGVSIQSLIQKGHGDQAELVLITHPSRERKSAAAIDQIAGLSCVRGRPMSIRVL